MYKKDYLLRLISELAKALATIVGLHKKGDTEEVLKQIDYSFDKLLKLKICDILSKAEEFSNSLEKEKIEMIAELLKIKGEIANNNKEFNEAKNLFEKSLEYFILAEKLMKTYSAERQRKIFELEELIRVFNQN